MPRKSVPSYRLHKPSGQARTIIDGRHVYLGKYNSPESRQRYARLLAELAQPGRDAEPVTNDTPKSLLLVSEVLVKYLEYAEVYYSDDGKPGKEFKGMVDAVAPVNELYGNLIANDFGPLKLKTIRQHMIDRDLCRTEVNKRVGRIKRVFKWAVSEELIVPSVYEGLRSVTGLRYGRTEARESKPVKPIDERFVLMTLPFVLPPAAAMARLQLLTGMRPGEVTAMQPELIDQSGEVWIYEPDKHKNRWRGHRRQVPLGPNAQEILLPFMDRPDTKHLFSPAEAEAWRHEQRAIHRNRTTKIYPCELKAREKRRKKAHSRKSKRARGDRYCSASYRKAIEYGITKANRELKKQDPDAELIPNWTPYRLRHTYATRIRRSHGVEAAQLGLGHARTNIVDIYAEKNLSLLIELAKNNG